MRLEFLREKEIRKYEKRYKKKLGSFIGDDNDINSDDCDDERKKFERMNFEQKRKHMIKQWHVALTKGRAGNRILSWVNGIKTKILRFGITGKKQI